MWRTSLVVLGLVLMIVPAQIVRPQHNKTDPGPRIIWNGNELWSACEQYKTSKAETQLGGACFFFISGVSDVIFTESSRSGSGKATLFSRSCPGSHVTRVQVVDVVVKWLDEHPQKRDLPASLLIATALTDAWPCD